MKKIIVILSLLFIGGAISPASAQNVNVNININIDHQPDWGPVGYSYVEFYYFPDLNIYYDIMHSVFYYRARNTWISSRYLPNSYRRYDLYGMYKVVINNQPQPWLYNRTHKRSYSMYKNDRTQTAIRYSSDNRYNTSRSNNVRWTQPMAHPQTNNANTTSNRRQSTTTNSNRRQSTTNNKQQSTGRNSQSNTNRNNTSSRTTTGTTSNRR